jgi:hypothetical protein
MSMQLVGHPPGQFNFHFVRDLSNHEVEQHQAFTSIISEARSRLKLFRILHHNYSEWQNYIEKLLNPAYKDDHDALEHLDRLLLNYLTCAYTIREHFKVSFTQRFRSTPSKQAEYEKFIKEICSHSFPFAFFLDFRGYVQHVGLGVGNYHRQIDVSFVRVSVTQNAEDLLAGSRLWTLSRLNKSHGEIDLIKTLQEFHVRMLEHYAPFVARVFFPDLLPAAKFYAGLTKEVKTVNSNFQMIFTEKVEAPVAEGDTLKLTLNLTQVPNSLFAELGISIRPAQPALG